MIARGKGVEDKINRKGLRVETSSYKINKSQGYNIYHKKYSR